MSPIPVVLDTDIGTDIDDTWALALILRSPEVDLKLITTATGDTTYRAKIVARLLEAAGRTDIPIGIGLRQSEETGPQEPWVRDYDLSSYPGCILSDGVGALIDAIMTSAQQVTLVAIGPLTNIGAALDREPLIAERARFVGMLGDLRHGLDSSILPTPEYNVRCDPSACQRVFEAPWSITMAPLDTCALVTLAGARYAAVRDCADPLTRAVVENYRIWGRSFAAPVEERSSVLYDTVAVYLAFPQDLLAMERLRVRVTDDGLTLIDSAGREVSCARAWRDLSAFEDLVVARLSGTAPRAAGGYGRYRST